MIAVQTYVPEKLHPFVKSFWRLEVNAAPGQPYEEDIIPDGHHEIIFHLQARSGSRKTEHQYWAPEPEAFFAGQTLRSYSLQLSPGAVLYGIRFYPHTLALLFDFPATTITDHLLPLADIPAADRLRSCITEHAPSTFSRLENMLYARIAALQPPDSFRYVHASVAAILQQKGHVKVDALVRAAGISGRHLDNSFKKFAGITPKTLCNIVKLNHFIHHKKQHAFKSLTACTYEAEFYDQSHLIKLFRAFTGKSPGTFFSDAHYISGHFTAM
ncbi:AraC family transcriptional regulator [Chitinophaga japonensis]|uniref:AraC-like DNA-binding protein n=1 Tax=Chitinophaga japonensis TaxID=104662 RepID=A0A562TC47_CHIJA|nr:helix-turn-helix domain-containing protein [Chitinophaga japonensis]TWI91127.1 AraC-like DNA-binding protein [Chitinophaga japonensis]